MKKVLLFTMLLLPQLLAAQEIYDTYLKDGKQWAYSQVISESNCTDPDPNVFKYGDWEYRELHFQSFITVMGDTVRGKDTYKKLYYTDSYRDTTYLIATIGERRGLYHIYDEGGSHVSYNFDLDKRQFEDFYEQYVHCVNAWTNDKGWFLGLTKSIRLADNPVMLLNGISIPLC